MLLIARCGRLHPRREGSGGAAEHADPFAFQQFVQNQCYAFLRQLQVCPRMCEKSQNFLLHACVSSVDMVMRAAGASRSAGCSMTRFYSRRAPEARQGDSRKIHTEDFDAAARKLVPAWGAMICSICTNTLGLPATM